jgi:hypothetical protein
LGASGIYRLLGREIIMPRASRQASCGHSARWVQKSMARRLAEDSLILRMASRPTSPCTKGAFRAISSPKITTSYSLAMRLNSDNEILARNSYADYEITMKKGYWVVAYKSLLDESAVEAYGALALPAVESFRGRF